MHRPTHVALLALFLFAAGFAEEAITNDSVVKAVKAGLPESVIVGMVKTQPCKFSLLADDLISLKKDGVSDAVIAAMVARVDAPSTTTAAAPPAAAAEPAKTIVADVGVYYKRGEAWAEMLPEPVNWKEGGFMKTIATSGLVKGDVNGNVKGGQSRNKVTCPIEVLIYAPEGVAVTEYQFLRLRAHKDSREFRTVTGGVFHASGGASRDQIDFEGKKIASRTYLIT